MNTNPRHVVTGEIRMSYEHIFQPQSKNDGGEPKYGVTVLVPKQDTATKQRIDMALQAAINEGVQSKWNGVKPPIVSICVYDGDGVRPSDGMPFGDECKGNWVFTASSKSRPQVVDANCNPIIDQTQVYSGCYGRVGVDFFAYANQGKKGIGCSLCNVQKLRDGESLGNHVSAEEDFGAPQQTPQQNWQAQAFQPQAQPQQINPITGQPM